ncbi:unnamed protein product [Leptidea sinapis]|uniref:Uncharacterized protein n=1 Tax=Leptidea sinapis TaxID=189913 RepID=A0A5E4QU44_9NEOP|nr:unnamed protein product [Leptidea sinapis]
MIQLVPILSYVAINIQKDSYVPMPKRDRQACVKYDTDTYTCPLKEHIYQMRSDENLCLRNQLTNQCETTNTICRNSWTELSNLNTYLFFCCGQCTIRIICESHVTAEQLMMAGIITLSDDCIIKGDSFTLFPHRKLSNIVHQSADVLKIDIPPINDIMNISIPSSAIETINITNPVDVDLERISQQIREMK